MPVPPSQQRGELVKEQFRQLSVLAVLCELVFDVLAEGVGLVRAGGQREGNTQEERQTGTKVQWKFIYPFVH